VHDARANGHSWDEIARALATSPVEARLRFDPQSPVADGSLDIQDVRVLRTSPRSRPA
jgi:hypothetical protein